MYGEIVVVDGEIGDALARRQAEVLMEVTCVVARTQAGAPPEALVAGPPPGGERRGLAMIDEDAAPEGRGDAGETSPRSPSP